MEMIKNLPALVVRGITPIPNNDFRVEVGREMSVKAIDDSEKSFGKYMIILVQKNPLIDQPTISDIEEYGVLAKIAMKIKLPNGNYKVKYTVLKRIKVANYILTSPYFVVEYDEHTTVYHADEEEATLTKMIVTEIAALNKMLFLPNSNVFTKIQQGVSAEELVDLSSYNLKMSEQEKYRYLVEADLNKRLNMLLKDIAKQKMIADIERKINEDVKESINESQKEFYLREKMRAIQGELGDKAKRDEEIDDLREKILEAKMPENIEEKALKELARFQSTPPVMAESNVIKAYLDFLVSLPWHQTSKDLNDLNKVQKALDKNHYGLEKVKDRIIEYLAVKIMTNKNPQTILCLVGPPGVGKTSLGVSIADALNRKFVKASLGGVHDESEIRGHRRTYVGALPGRILRGMQSAGTINPVFLLDEIDKMASNFRGDPASAMLEVLDPEQNANFSDHYLEENYDLSQVLFITTANYLQNIPAPLRDRMEIVELSSYTEHEKFEIARKHLLGKQLEAHGIDKKQFSISDDAIYYLIRHYTREAGVRELNRYFGTLIRKAVKEILMTKVKEVTITVDNIEEYIGKPKFTHNLADKENQIGVATGLAFTAFGGDILPVEVTTYPGKGKLVLTGKLGDVMKESAQTSLSYIKANADDFGIKDFDFEKNDVHVHFPEGAIPKDGPSAGITITTAILSVLANKYIDREVGMTGEITLRGQVLPIGGLREKAIAAHRSGLKVILIPKENEKDIEDIPKEVKEALEVVLVTDFKEILNKAFA